jgi:hypothetical protein
MTLHYITLGWITLHYMTLHEITLGYMTLHDIINIVGLDDYCITYIIITLLPPQGEGQVMLRLPCSASLTWLHETSPAEADSQPIQPANHEATPGAPCITLINHFVIHFGNIEPSHPKHLTRLKPRMSLTISVKISGHLTFTYISQRFWCSQFPICIQTSPTNPPPGSPRCPTAGPQSVCQFAPPPGPNSWHTAAGSPWKAMQRCVSEKTQVKCAWLCIYI